MCGGLNNGKIRIVYSFSLSISFWSIRFGQHRPRPDTKRHTDRQVETHKAWEDCDKSADQCDCVGRDITVILRLVSEERWELSWFVFTRFLFGPHHSFRKSNAPMMRPIGCWREKKVCYKMFCATVGNILIPDKKRRKNAWCLSFSLSIFLLFLLLNVSDSKAGDLFVCSTQFYRCSGHTDGIGFTA